MHGTTKLRVARPTDNLSEVMRFYKEGLGLSELYRFENDDGFDGAMLGVPGAPYHFEFTTAHGHTAGRAPTEDNLLVFYIPDEQEWTHAVERLKRLGAEPARSFNPFWDERGITFEDPDGYRVVLQRASWER